jgi:hypothetical protein
MRRFFVMLGAGIVAVLVLRASVPVRGQMIAGSKLVNTATEEAAADPSSVGAGIARGCTTVWYIDWDCDGYGPGVRSSGVYGWDVLGVGNMPDADDEDADINTTATVIAEFGSGGSLSNAQLKTFLATLGYTAENVFYVSTTGNNGTGAADTPASPYATYDGLSANLDPGDVVVYRAGTYLNPYIGSAAPELKSGAVGEPIIYMSYPGEVVHFNTTGSNSGIDMSQFGGGDGATYVIVDGFTMSNDTNPGVGTPWSCAGAQNAIVRNVETSDAAYPSCIDGHDNLTVERVIFHHMEQHGFYMGSNTRESTNIIVQDSIAYANGYDHANENLSNQYGGFKFNGRCTGCTWQRNISHSNSAWGLGFDEGVNDTTIANNVFFNNGSAAVVMQLYLGQDSCAIVGGNDDICPYEQNNNLFINNTIWVGTHRADGCNGVTCSIFPEDFPAFLIARGTDTCIVGGASVAPANCTMVNTFRNNVIVIANGAAWRPIRTTSFTSPTPRRTSSARSGATSKRVSSRPIFRTASRTGRSPRLNPRLAGPISMTTQTSLLGM